MRRRLSLVALEASNMPRSSSSAGHMATVCPPTRRRHPLPPRSASTLVRGSNPRHPPCGHQRCFFASCARLYYRPRVVTQQRCALGGLHPTAMAGEVPSLLLHLVSGVQLYAALLMRAFCCRQRSRVTGKLSERCPAMRNTPWQM